MIVNYLDNVKVFLYFKSQKIDYTLDSKNEQHWEKDFHLSKTSTSSLIICFHHRVYFLHKLMQILNQFGTNRGNPQEWFLLILLALTISLYERQTDENWEKRSLLPEYLGLWPDYFSTFGTHFQKLKIFLLI